MPQTNAILVRISRYRSTLLGALLVVALAVTGVVTFQAYQASRNYKQVVERMLHDYVATAANQFMQDAAMNLNGCVNAIFGKLTDRNVQELSESDLTACGNSGTAHFEVKYPARVVASNAAIPTGLIREIENKAHRRDLARYRGWDLGVATSSRLQKGELVAFAVLRDSTKTSLRLVGVITNGMLDSVAAYILKMHPLLSPELANGQAVNEVWKAKLVFAESRPAPATEYFQRTSLVAPYDELAAHVELTDPALHAITPEGIPEDRGYQYLGMFLLALGLVASSVLLLRRESQLAIARASFVSSVSHELRTPLAQIRMFAEMLLLGRVRNESDQRRSLEIIDNEAKRLSHLVENVLQAARSERGKITINPTDANLAPIIRDAAESFMALSESRRIDFRLELQDNLMVNADSDAVRHIVLNLLDNAAKYGPVGQRIVVGFAFFEDTARLWVDDEGPGVPPRERERIFQPFYRSQRDLVSTTAGSGIGLAIVRELAALHGGSAWVEDAPGNGARVVIEFPGAYVATTQQQSSDWAVA